MRALRSLLDRQTFRLSDSDLELLFRPIASAAGLMPPLSKAVVNGYEVDFFWPDLGLIVETDGLRYHRTASAQTRDRRRDQTHTAAGLTQLRFTHYQVKYDRAHVRSVLEKAAVKEMIRAANHIRHRPYRWGGGHRSWSSRGYDCSGSVSYVMHAAGLLDHPLDSTGFMRWGGGGPGSWVRIYANREHVFAVIAGLRWDTTSEEGDGHGPAGARRCAPPAASDCATRSACWRHDVPRVGYP